MKTTKIMVVALIASLPLAAPAATVTQCGSSLCFQYDNAQAAVGLFGLPSLVGNSMQFIPPSFRAEAASTGAPVTATTTATFLFDRVYTVDSHYEVSTIQVIEAGDYAISGDTGGNPDTVGVHLHTTLTDNLVVQPSLVDDAFFNQAGDSGGSQTWIVVGGMLNTSAMGITPDVAITVGNTLTAFADEAGGDAWVQKKFTVTVGTALISDVPVPGAAWLFGSALGLLGLRRKAGA